MENTETKTVTKDEEKPEDNEEKNEEQNEEENPNDNKFYTEVKDAIKETITNELPSVVESKMGDVQKDIMAKLETERHFGIDAVPQEVKDGFVHDIVNLKDIEAKRVEPKVLGKALDETTEGADLVPTILYNEIQRVAYEHGIVMRDAFRVPMTSDTTNLPIYSGSTLNGGFIANDQANRSTVTTPTFNHVALAVKDWYTLVPVSLNLLSDTNTRLYDFLLGLFAEGYASMMDKQGFVGTASGSDAFSGIMHNTNVPKHTLATGNTKNSQVTIKDILLAQAALPASLRRGAAWFMSSSMWAHIRGSETSGNYVLNSNNAALLRAQFTEGIAPAGFIESYPVYEVSDLPAYSDTAAASTKFMAFANLGKALAFGDREEFNVRTSDEANYGSNSAFTLKQRIYMPSARYALSVYETKAAITVETAAS